jgi:hypothetical protein
MSGTKQMVPDAAELEHHARLSIRQRLIYDEILKLATRLRRSYPVSEEDIARLMAFVVLAQRIRWELADNVERVNAEMSKGANQCAEKKEIS